MVCSKSEVHTGSLTQYPTVAHIQTEQHGKKTDILSDPQDPLKVQAGT